VSRRETKREGWVDLRLTNQRIYAKLTELLVYSLPTWKPTERASELERRGKGKEK